MGTAVGRIEKEFVFKSLVDEGAAADIHGARKEVRARFTGSAADAIDFAPLEGTSMEGFQVGEEVRVFFYLKNNYHTFSTPVLAVEKNRLRLRDPKGVYKNLQRKYERVKATEDIEVYFSVKGKKIELNFPKTEHFSAIEDPLGGAEFDPAKMASLVSGFRAKMEKAVARNKIVMLRDRLPKTYEEKALVRLGKCLWIPSTEEDWPSKDPFAEPRIIVKRELVRLEEEEGVQPYMISGKLGNILFEKARKDIYSELFCPIIYFEYLVGYIYLCNTGDKRERISKDLLDHAWVYSKVLCYSLMRNGYFKSENSLEQRFEAAIVDISASGVLFAHPSVDLARELLVHSDLDLTVRIGKRQMVVGSRIMRKIKDDRNVYFGVQFMRIEPEDFRFLYERIYGKVLDEEAAQLWEGGAPPPKLEL